MAARELLRRPVNEWTLGAQSATDAVATWTIGAPGRGRRHLVAGVEISASAAPTAPVAAQLVQGASSVLEQFELPTTAFAPLIIPFKRPIQIDEDASVKLVLPALGATKVGSVRLVGRTEGATLDSVPPVLEGMVARYDASRITGLADGEAVVQLDDLSGAGNHGVQATAGFRGVYKVNITNGLPGILFDGVDDRYVAAALPPAGPRTTFVAGRSSADGGAFVGWGRDDANAGSYSLRRDDFAGFDDTPPLDGFHRFRTGADVPVVLVGWMTSTDAFFRADGIQVGTPIGDTVNIVGGGMHVGRGDSLVEQLVGYVFEIFHVDADLTLAQVQAGENYLITKWL